MFGFGKSAKLDERERLLQEREQALNAREKALNAREREFNIREKRLKERETAVSQWEREAAEKLKRAHLRKEEALKTELSAQAKLNLLDEASFQLRLDRENFLLWKQKETNNLQKNAEAQIQEQRKKGFQEGLFRGRLEGLTSGKKDYRALERESEMLQRGERGMLDLQPSGARKKKKIEKIKIEKIKQAPVTGLFS